ncbi:MAG: sigma-54-dependent transcriptional regulator [Chromatocurvus sp.]
MADPLLIIEDEELLANELARFFSKQDWDVQVAGSLAGARKLINEETADPMVILADVSLPDGNIFELMEEVHSQRKPIEWVLLTGYGSVPDSVRALQLGALDFLEKPCSTERLSVVINGARRGASAQRRLRRQSAEGSRRYVPEAFIGDSQPAQRVREMVRRLIGVPFSSLVISGETGTGKGLVARILHHSGARAEAPLIEVNCAAFPRDLAESELFGHEAGAFTGAKGRHRGYLEQADGGTLFLDEIGELDLDLQAKLLTVIEDQKVRRVGGEKSFNVDIQVIAASNAQLERKVRKQEFRSDLFHRLSVFQFALPALRERIEDLEQLVPVFIEEFNARSNKRIKHIGERNLRQMSLYHWPGNIREVRNVIERAVLLSEGNTLESRWLQLEQNKEPGFGRAEVDGDRAIIPLDGSMALDEMDSYIIKTALERNHQNVTATAKALGTTRETLRYRIQKYQLRPQLEHSSEQERVGVSEIGELN